MSDAAVRFGTAEMTIRRDLDVLVKRGVARRIRGGAVNLLMSGDELPFRLRELDAVDAKRRIGAAVAELISEGEAVALDSGTTLFEVAKNLTSVRATVLPMSLQSALVLSQAPEVRLIIPGGEVRGGEDVFATISAGVASYALRAADETELIARADDALYESKRRGRNRVTIHTGSTEESEIPASLSA